MSKDLTVKVHRISVDGLPDEDDRTLTGRVDFIFDGCIVSGWPLDDVGHPGEWGTNEDVGKHGRFTGVTHWIEFPVPVWELENCAPLENTDKATE